MSIVVEGVVRGGKVELIGGPELPDGHRVQVMIDPEGEEGTVNTERDDPGLRELLAQIRRDRAPLPPSPSGPDRLSAAGRLATDPTWDEHLREVLESRKSDVLDGHPE